MIDPKTNAIENNLSGLHIDWNTNRPKVWLHDSKTGECTRIVGRQASDIVQYIELEIPTSLSSMIDKMSIYHYQGNDVDKVQDGSKS